LRSRSGTSSASASRSTLSRLGCERLVLLWMRTDARETGTPFAPHLLVTPLAIGMAGPLAYPVHRALRRRGEASVVSGRAAPAR
jgi:hypothetical protein